MPTHRWHWTLDEDNPKRVSIRQYAKEVGVGFKRVANTVNGYAAWSSGDVGSHITLGECIERVSMSTERAAATEAVAKVHGMS